jgi:hypothetical protein
LHPDILLVSELAQECDLVITRNVFDLNHERATSITVNANSPKEEKRKKHTVQIPEFLKSLRKSGSLSIAASFSYANSSAIFADRAPSATESLVRRKGRKKRLYAQNRTRTGTFAEATCRYREGRPSGWQGA